MQRGELQASIPPLGAPWEVQGTWDRDLEAAVKSWVDGGGTTCRGAPWGTTAGVWLAMGSGPRPVPGDHSCGRKEELVEPAERKGVLTRPLLSNGLPEKEKEECQQRDGAVGLLAN